jgi:hypothetical protein
MNANYHRPTAQELAELNAYLAAGEHGKQPSPGEAGFPTGLTGELLRLAHATQPDPAFANSLELQLHQAANKALYAHPSGRLTALWQSFTQPERKTTMKRLIPFALVGIIILAILWITLPSLFPSPAPSQVALVTPPTHTPAPTPLSALTPTAIAPTVQPPVAISFTPQPIPSQPPNLPSLAKALSSSYGGSGSGNLPASLPVSLATELPLGPVEVSAYYCLENTPLTLEQAEQIASQWGLAAQFYMPGWMQSVTPDDIERSYIAVEGMQDLSMWNGELSYTNLAISPIYEGHQYPKTGLPPSDEAVNLAMDYLAIRGYLNFPYQVDLSYYDYGLVDFYRLLDGLVVNDPVASVTIDPQGRVGNVWINRAEYQSVGSYSVISAQAAWDLLSAGQPSDQLSISYFPSMDGNPQFWGRVYSVGQTAQLFGAPTYLLPADPASSPYVMLNNLQLVGDLSGLFEYLQSNQGYIHAWGQVLEVDDRRTLQLTGWEPFDEFSGYFNGTIRRTAEDNYLELSDGTQLSLPDLPADVPADLPIYAQGGRVGDTLEWFILQAYPADEGQLPPDLSQAQALVDKVQLVYLAPDLSGATSGLAVDPVSRMLIPTWSFSGHITVTGGQDLLYRAYVQAVPPQ